MAFNLLDHPIVTMAPDRVSGAWAWAEHAPFAFLAMELARPRCFVELGTHSGMSYLAFCQAVAALQLPTRCFAIDTWKGDEHAGKYDEILPGLRKYHDPLYGSFSQLVQTTFDEASVRFLDGTIDLLHIDGLHTYAAVKHDFETWLPKVSDRGIVLFHDTAVTDRNFGVYKLWQELEGQYPSFEFKHSFGLGVLGVGKSLPEGFVEFLQAAPREPEKYRAFFEALGARASFNAKYMVLLRFFFNQQIALNQWKREIGRAADGKLEMEATALEGGADYAHHCMEQVGELINEDLKLRQKMGATIK
jgi:O-antigen biosynthesis protein